MSWQSPCPVYDPPHRELMKSMYSCHTQETMALTKKLQIIRFEAERLVHVLQKPTRRRDEDIHSRQALTFVLEILPADHESSRKAMIAAYRTQHVEYLDSLASRLNLDTAPVSNTHQFSRWGDDQSSESILRSPLSTIEYLECRNQKCEGFSTSCPCGTQDIFSL